MNTITDKQLRSRWWRLVLLLLIVLPFVPELAIYAVTVLAKLKGCEVTDKVVCTISNVPLSDIIAKILKAAVWVADWMGDYGIAVFWLCLCYLTITFGWRRLVSRLLLGLTVTLVFAVLPYFGPLLSIAHLANANCQPNEGGVGPCLMFGGNVGDVAHNTVNPKLVITGVVIALATSIVYVVVAVVIRFFSGLRSDKSRH